MRHDVYHMNIWPEEDTPEGSIQKVAVQRYDLIVVEHHTSPAGVCDVVEGEREHINSFVRWLFQGCEESEDFSIEEYLAPAE